MVFCERHPRGTAIYVGTFLFQSGQQPSCSTSFIRAAASMITTLIYDAPVLKNANDPSVVALNDFVDLLAHAAYPGAHLVEFFTWMRYLPSWMAKWKSEAVAGYEKNSIMFLKLYDEVCQRVVSNS